MRLRLQHYPDVTSTKILSPPITASNLESEGDMAAPLSLDIRTRISSAYKAKEGTVRVLASRFAVGAATITRLFNLERVTGSMQPRPHAGGPALLIPDTHLPRLKALVTEKPDRTAEEIRIEWNQREGTTVSRSVIVRALKRAKLTLKKNV